MSACLPSSHPYNYSSTRTSLFSSSVVTVRWAINCARWQTLHWCFDQQRSQVRLQLDDTDTALYSSSTDELIWALNVVASSEQNRLSRYHFQIDAKRSLAGQLLVYRLLLHLLGSTAKIRKQDSRIQRSVHGKPLWVSNDSNSSVQFSVSHHGDWVIVVGSLSATLVGCDVTSIELPHGNQSIGTFFRHMQRVFTSHEWRLIYDRKTERDQLTQFYWLWAHKEAFVKALGLGLGVQLQALEFHYPLSSTSISDAILSPLQLWHVNGSLLEGKADVRSEMICHPEWVFEGGALDKDTLAVICYGPVDVPSTEQKLPPLIDSTFAVAGDPIPESGGFEELNMAQVIRDLRKHLLVDDDNVT